MVGFLLVNHLFTCLWVMVAAFVDDEEYKGTWFEEYHKLGYSKYLTSFYWATTTITTVGYGDIGGNNHPEMVLCILIQVIGVTGFAFVSNSLTSIITSYD